MIPLFLYYFESGHKTTAFIVMLIAISTDWFDGQVARWTHTVSEMGKILDPLADKICALSVAAYFLWINELPVWFVSIVILRDIAIFFGGIFLKRRYHILTTALPTGKWAVGFMSIVFLAIVWPVHFEALETIKLAFLWLSTVLLVLSFLQYVWRMVQIIQGKPFKNL